MNLMDKHLKLFKKYNNLFAKAVDDVKVNQLTINQILFNAKKRRAFRTKMIRAEYYHQVSGRLCKELDELIKKEKLNVRT